MGGSNMKDTNIIIRVSDNLKKEFQFIVEENGYSISSVLEACIQTIVKKRKIPLNYLPYLKTSKRKYDITIPLIKRALEDIIAQLDKNKIKKVYLFGSFARGENNINSDIDLRVEVNEGCSLLDLGFISVELEEKLHRKVDIVSGNNIDPRFMKRIQNEEICIYENK